MKKHLIAAAVVSAFAAPAMAQNVQVYGIVDTSVQYYDNGTDGYARINDSTLATSRLGFRGTEDLGGGLKAEFQIEAKLNPSSGSTNATAAVTTATNVSYQSTLYTDSALFTREAWVGLSGGFGAVRIGRSDLTNAANIDSRVSQAGNLALTTGQVDNDVGNMVRYTTPSFNGLQAELGYAFANTTSTTNGTTTGKATANNVSSLYLNYTSGPLGLHFGRSILENGDAVNENIETKVGASYDFGIVSVGYMLHNRDNENSAADVKRQRFSIKAPMSNGVAFHAVLSDNDVDGGTVTGDSSAVTLAVTKAFSKRTTGYAAYISTDNKPTATMDTKSFTVGVAHSF